LGKLITNAIQGTGSESLVGYREPLVLREREREREEEEEKRARTLVINGFSFKCCK